MQVSRWAACALCALGLPVAATAASWTGKGQAGVLISRGNADATSANAKLDVAQEFGPWKNALDLAALYSRNAAFTTAQSALLHWQTNYKFNPKVFWFGALDGIQDRFSGFSYQASVSTGLGYQFSDTDATKFSVTLGVGYRRLRPETLIESPAGEVLQRIKGDATGQAIGTAGLDYDHQLTSTTRLTEKLQVLAGASNTAVQNDIALQVNMTQALALSLGFGVRYNSNPPPGAVSTDKQTTINLVYNFNPGK